MSARRSVGFLAIVILYAVPVFGQLPAHETGSIEGTVRDGLDEHAFGNVRVELKPQTTGAAATSTLTSENGDFEFAGLPPGEYTLEVKLPGYEPFRVTAPVVNSGKQRLPVFLKRLQAAAAATYRYTISVHELAAPRKARDEFEKGVDFLYTKSDFKAAISEFQRAIQLFPTYYEAFAQEGTAYYNLEQKEAAEQAIRKSVALSSGRYPDALFLLADLLNETDRPAEAEKVSRQGIAIDDSSWSGHFELARALYALGVPEEAKKDAVEARDLKPDNAETYLLLANIDLHRNDSAALFSDLDSYLRIAPEGPETEDARRNLEAARARLQKPQSPQQSSKNEQPASGGSDLLPSLPPLQAP